MGSEKAVGPLVKTYRKLIAHKLPHTTFEPLLHLSHKSKYEMELCSYCASLPINY
jgi:hypothetical protein